MKRILAIILVLCMTLGMVVSVSAAPSTPFSRALNLVRLIRAMFADDDEDYGIGELKDDVLTVYVATNGKKDANGTKNNPYATIIAARDALRKINKNGLDGIDIVVKSGVYPINDPIVLEEQDGGSKNCPVRIIGETDAKIVGGISISASEFAPAAGEITNLFPEANKIVMLDLTKYGYTVDEIGKMLAARNYIKSAPGFSVDGILQTIARYPNESEGWTNIIEGWMIDRSGNITPYTDNDVSSDHEQYPVEYKIQYGEQYMETVQSWSDSGHIKVAARFNQLWCTDNTDIKSISKVDATFTTPYTGGYEPLGGTVMYWYNIPEELDVPGEFYIDKNGMMYYYPVSGFETATIALPVSDGIFNISGNYVTIENLTLESSRKNGITANGDNFTVINCEISAISGEHAIHAIGDNITVRDSVIHDCRCSAITIETGNIETLERGNSLVYNNEIYNFGLHDWPYTMGVNVAGCGSNVSHNHIYNSKTRAIYWSGAYQTIEYNDVHDVLTASDDIGAISSDERVRVGNVIRYNYIHNIGCVGALADIDKINPDYRYVGSAAIYGDFGGSYFEAYGNVIMTVNGNGFWLFGRGVNIHGNLIIDCSNWYLGEFAMQWDDIYLYNKGSGKYKVPDYIFSDVWKEANPDLASLKFDLTNVPADDPLGWAMPGDNVIKNNWCHYNKGIRDFTNWGAAPYMIQNEVFQFCGDNIDLATGAKSNDNMSIYNSRRETVDLEKLITETAAGVIEIDWETFQSIGLVTEE
ncbi:MAG: right-handed parallel beta-helix repeat-containing protein [Ruminococcaceae bacterium]|nr:right-handed parallel beta-helix repeat-containing protein [Oscillospiraceae bacterium]